MIRIEVTSPVSPGADPHSPPAEPVVFFSQDEEGALADLAVRQAGGLVVGEAKFFVDADHQKAVAASKTPVPYRVAKTKDLGEPASKDFGPIVTNTAAAEGTVDDPSE